MPCAGLILQSTFTSIPDMAPRVVPIFPKFLVRTQYDNLAKVPKISCRKLFLHSQADEMITKRLHEALALVDIRVLDHVVIAKGDYVSFAARGLL